MKKTITITKYLVQAGVATKQRGIVLLQAGRISVNKQIVTRPDFRVTKEDHVYFDQQLLTKKNLYLMLNKPRGYLTGENDVLGRPSMYDLLPEPYKGVYPAGRLDFDSRGLLLLSNNSKFIHSIIHPQCKIGKKYLVTIKGSLDDAMLTQLEKGIPLSEGLTLPAKVKFVKGTPQGSLLEFTLWEGKNRQIRRMCYFVGLEVIDLYRFQIGQYEIGDLAEGEFREIE